MPANDVVRARIDRRIKEEAAAILGAAGLTISDAFRMMLMRTVADKALSAKPARALPVARRDVRQSKSRNASMVRSAWRRIERRARSRPACAGNRP